MSQLKRISITKLTIGSYVQAVSKQLSSVKIVKTGWVRNKKAISELKREGVIEVIIDINKQLETAQKDEATEKESQQKKITKSFEQELVSAKKLQDKMNTLLEATQKRILDNAPIDILALEQVAESIINSVTNHPHCLACLVRINHQKNSILEHLQRVAIMLAQNMVFHKVSFSESVAVVLAGLTHDLGKLLLPVQLQQYEALLTPQLRQKRLIYVKNTIDILKVSGGTPQLTLKICYQQMERLNGSGYPKKLTADSLPKISKLFAIIDEFDSLTSGFEGNKIALIDKAHQALMLQSPTIFDKNLLQSFIKTTGLYIAGSLVKLKTGKIGYIKEFKHEIPMKPIVHCFFNAQFDHHIEAKDIDLSGEFINDSIESTVDPKQFQLNLSDYI
ncbi:HD-GYP domain-containing protein [Pseudoalteromonas denitrificans]|uniref:HD-GYP domain, c-di-GMP phosphodiesterase class II (Or its inactivated variant) n=1 Tax=Pseudoalteromonas denitrificans DSM 6059 TaxID=1123010 RepID=A0A1I1J787_9GAMM|nr:HD domain-containing phosphohydrolase [Pseudoalteromonas denitrificans]SFC44479.1 HD-GYP domain, c-di-GMP phosphodiesterase class II (or its inactivated variant) [Pseudoalteromonas denitrificans DSM 6059]